MHRLALFALLVGGCSKSDSGDILTSGMYGSIHARAEGDGKTHVVTSLFLGQPIDLNFIELSDDDKLVVRHAGQEMTPSEGELLNIVSYTATFNTEAEGEMFEVAFQRTVDAGAPSSIATLPTPFTLAAPPATSSRAAAMTLTWSPSGSGNTMTASIDGSCIDLVTVPITGDTGSVTIPADMIKKKMAQQGQTIPDSCTAEIRIERQKMGTLDSHFGKGGSVQGIQARKATFTTNQ
ncbi:MAG: hypothetical protein ABI175_04975 [Polyangiales bacterium]